mmetsp:Transcript_35035/g.63993  ORF Transcript_35035/g.63993 Transcript_35035/m.63993 type:complete len:256 (-) Transcript_35035:610-1377(-)
MFSLEFLIVKLATGWRVWVMLNYQLFSQAPWHLERLMHILCWHLLQLWKPVAYVLPIGVVVPGLLCNVEFVDPPASKSCCRDPIAPIGIHIIVQQQILKMFRTFAPVHAKVKYQIRSYILAPTVGHEPCGGQLTHVGVHKGHTCLPFYPPLEQIIIFLWFGSVRAAIMRTCCNAIFTKDAGAMLHHEESEEIAPQHLERHPIGILACSIRTLKFCNFMVHRTWGQTAVRKPRCELCRIVRTQHPISCFKILTHFL